MTRNHDVLQGRATARQRPLIGRSFLLRASCPLALASSRAQPGPDQEPTEKGRAGKKSEPSSVETGVAPNFSDSRVFEGGSVASEDGGGVNGRSEPQPD